MITVAGSRDLIPTQEMAIRLMSIISTTDRIGIRSTRYDQTGPIERLVTIICESLGVPVVQYSPSSGGRAKVYLRDYALVRSSTSVFAVFSPDRVMDGGTGHIIKAALDEEIPVEAYTIDDDGSLMMIGSDDGNPFRVHAGSRPDILVGMWEG